MSNDERPFIESCGFCANGLLRFLRCSTCDEIVAFCDECELMWKDVGEVSEDPNLPSDSNFPTCPACGELRAEFQQPSPEEIEEMNLDRFSAGNSV